jgi:phosphonate metabolism protein PhnN/1,5-bisphosphokinase (PRPP-forming)
MAGILFLVVGPSGAGKDTLLEEARRRLADDPGFLFVQRTITRPAAAGGEAHRAIDPRQFAAEEAAGRFALCWRAHGLAYGIPAGIDAALAAGRRVVANGSRRAIAAARARYPALHVIHVTAPPAMRRARLAARGREAEALQAARLARDVELPAGLALTEIVNDRSIAEGAERLIDALQREGANGAR